MQNLQMLNYWDSSEQKEKKAEVRDKIKYNLGSYTFLFSESRKQKWERKREGIDHRYNLHFGVYMYIKESTNFQPYFFSIHKVSLCCYTI